MAFNYELALKLRFAYSVIGLVLGAVCILAGVMLGLSGVVGHTSFAAQTFGLSTKVSDAAPGVVVFFVGAVFVALTRFRVFYGNDTPEPSHAKSVRKGGSTVSGGGGGGGLRRSKSLGGKKFASQFALYKRDPDDELPRFGE